jgi:hypothetical protein
VIFMMRGSTAVDTALKIKDRAPVSWD